MTPMRKVLTVSRILVASASLLMIVVFFVPFWQIQMWAPQYPEWLHMKIWLHKITGDIDIINGLNHYIGMKYIKVEMFPEFKIMPYVLAGIIAFGLFASINGRGGMVWAFFIVLILAGTAGLVDFYLWGYDYGHNLDPTAAIQVPGMSYQPPLIGTKELLNFIAYSAPDVGGLILAFSGILVGGVLGFEYYKKNPSIKK
jgi:copper chaperone NosL